MVFQTVITSQCSIEVRQRGQQMVKHVRNGQTILRKSTNTMRRACSQMAVSLLPTTIVEHLTTGLPHGATQRMDQYDGTIAMYKCAMVCYKC